MDPILARVLTDSSGQRRRGIRVVGDVHGSPVEFAQAIHGAIAQNYAVISLGDIIDYGPDSPKTMEMAATLVEEGWGLIIPGNHDAKFMRWIRGERVTYSQESLGQTLEQLKQQNKGISIAYRYASVIARMPIWLTSTYYCFTHGAFSPEMITNSPPFLGRIWRRDRTVNLALNGETDGQSDKDGKIIRTYNWIDTVPQGLTVMIGHDCLSKTKIITKTGKLGGEVQFLDTGCGEDGKLSWVDIPINRLGPINTYKKPPHFKKS